MHLNIKYGLVVGIAEIITSETGKNSHLSANFHFPRSLKFLWPSSSNPAEKILWSVIPQMRWQNRRICYFTCKNPGGQYALKRRQPALAHLFLNSRVIFNFRNPRPNCHVGIYFQIYCTSLFLMLALIRGCFSQNNKKWSLDVGNLQLFRMSRALRTLHESMSNINRVLKRCK